MADYNPWIQDYVTIADTEAEIVNILYLSISDTISIAENLAFLYEPLGLILANSISVVEDIEEDIIPEILSTNNSISIAENIVLEVTPLLLTVTDTPSIAENIALKIPGLLLTTNDSILVADVKAAGGLFPLVVFDNVYIRDYFWKAISDADVSTVADTIAATQLILASATRTAATYLSNAFKVSSALLIRWYFDVTAEVGTSTLDIILQTSPDNLVWYDAVTADQISATGQYTTTMTEPGIYVRAKCTVAGTSFTFSVKMTKHMPVRRFERRYRSRRSLART